MIITIARKIPQAPDAQFNAVEVSPLGPAISCILPTLGRGPTLCETIHMLMDQSLPAHEVIVVDQTPRHDANTECLLAAWQQQRVIQWLRQPEPNASKARNTGALAATGNVLLFLDDDIRIEHDFLFSYAEAFSDENVDAVCGPVLEGDAKLVSELPSRALLSELGWLLHFPKNYANHCHTSFMMSGNMAVRRGLFLSLGGMDENYEKGAYREESDFAMRFRQAGYRFCYSPKCRLFHLGASGAPGGGARTWQNLGAFWYFHHCVGDWYFNLGFANIRNAASLLARSLRHFVINRQGLNNPWRIPFAFLYWLAALPVAARKRLSGPRLLRSNSST